MFRSLVYYNSSEIKLFYLKLDWTEMDCFANSLKLM